MTISSPDTRPLRSPRPTGPNRPSTSTRWPRPRPNRARCPRTSAQASEADDADLVEQETVVYGEDDDSR